MTAQPGIEDRAGGAGRRSRRTPGSAPVGLRAATLVVGLAFATPLLFLLLRNLELGGVVLSELSETRNLAALGRSLLLATSVTATTSVLGTAAAWTVMRTDLPGAMLWRTLLPLPLVIPSFIGAFALIAAFASGGLVPELLAPLGIEWSPSFQGFWGSLAVLTLLTYPYVYLPVAARLRQLPASLEEAARLTGRRPLQVFRSVVLPQVRTAILAGALLVFLYALSEFGAVALLRYETLPVRIFFNVLDETTSMALALELGVLAVAVVVAERFLVKSPRRVEGSGTSRDLVVPLGRWRVAAYGFLGALLGLALLAPVGVLTFWAVRGLVRGSTRASAVVGDLGQLVEPAVNTAVISVVTAAIAVAVIAPLAYLAVRHRSRVVAPLSNAFVVGGFALPGLAIALSLVFWSLSAPGAGFLYQTHQLLVFAYVVHFGAQALRAAEVAVASVPARIDDAARGLGAGRARRLATIDLPLMGPGLLAGAGLVLLSTMKELPATLLLAPAGFETLVTRIWASTQEAFLADASVAALLLLVLSGVLTWFLVVRRAEALQ